MQFIQIGMLGALGALAIPIIIHLMFRQRARLVELRYFAGLTSEQAAKVLYISPSTADRHWTYARAWLRNEVRGR